MPVSLTIHTFLNGSFEENCYLAHLAGAKQGILVDPGSSPEELKAAIAATGVKPVLILATHGHVDHVGAVQSMKEAYGAPFACHGDEEALLEGLEDSYAFYGLGTTRRPRIDQAVKDGDLLKGAGMEWRVIHTPGHSPGSLCLYHQDSGTLFSGDTLFKQSIGRSDFPGGSAKALLESIRGKLYVLPDATRVLPGHGEETTLGAEKKDNPFTQG